METTQLSIFDQMMTEKVPGGLPIKPKIQKAPKVRDIRTEGQINRAVAYDVGEKIGGARKDLAKSRADFLAKPSLQLLDELESADVTAAAELIIRETFFNWFSLQDCKERGVDPGTAKAIQLFINRIPKESKDCGIARKKYTNALVIMSDLLKTVKTKKEFHAFETYLVYTINVRLSERSAASYARDIANGTEHDTAERKLELQEMQAKLFVKEISDACMDLSDYAGPFRNYFYKHSSRVSLLRNAYSVKSWDELLPPKTEKAKTTTTKRKPVWERELPDVPVRSAGSPITIKNPQHYVDHFNFRASEFGHYVDDAKGLEHILRSAEAFTDLTELLDIPSQSVSLGGELAMAFGSRGRGRALGHYEPGRKVINLTKQKGSLGILAHEWFHSLDHFLFNKSYNFENGKPGFLTDLSYGHMISVDATEAAEDLIEAIKVGETMVQVDVSDCTNTYTVNSKFIRRYNQCGGNLDKMLEFALIDFDADREFALSMYPRTNLRAQAEKKFAKQRTTLIRTTAEALRDYHFKQTGEKVDTISYPVFHSNYYQYAINMDKGSVGKYWSSNIELAARAFEFYIFEKMKEKNWTSDYLVCGIRDSVFPLDEKEKRRIYNAMDRFMKAIQPILSE